VSADAPERIDPESDLPGVVAHHLKKYEFARSYVHGLTVDVACGVGYGTAHVAPAATKAVGLDVDDSAIRTAAKRYRANGETFLQGNAQRLPFRDGAVRTVLCFEGIEHFRDAREHLAEVMRVLEPSGVYIVSTPKARGGNGDPNPDNPYHRYEFSPGELEALLRGFFDEVTLMGQHRKQTAGHRVLQQADVLKLRKWKWLRWLAKGVSRMLGTAPVDQATLDDFVIDYRIEGCSEMIAICRRPRKLDTGPR
jgi:ubiquinone/menaquinone biosynthesis C-methylase UbiE